MNSLSKMSLIVTFIMLVLLVPIGMCQSSADDLSFAQPDDISVSPSVSNITIKAGDSQTLYLDIHNKLPYDENDPNELVVYVYFPNSDDISVSFPDGNRTVVQGQAVGSCKLTVTADKYASSVSHILSFRIMINDPDRGSPIQAEATDLVRIEVHSTYSSGDNYNKIMGVWNNPLPEPLNQPIWTTALSFLLWLAVAIIVAYFIVPWTMNGWKVAHEKVEEGLDMIDQWEDERK